MKKTVLLSVIVALLSLPMISNAQSAMDELYEKYAGKKGFTSVNISKEMFQLFSQLEVKGDGVEEARQLSDKMDGMKILTYTPSKGEIENFDFYAEIIRIFPVKEYVELMRVKEEGEEVQILIKKDGEKIADFLLIAKEANEIVVMNITGMLTMEDINKVSSQMNIEVMEDLK
ncbi:MAG: DUF4252 domain-containing protein [Bacteroidales bacterium]|nr:DUF4252 domain-containing protein [Bacteroidales bacterium]